jgi:hypothetical protein
MECPKCKREPWPERTMVCGCGKPSAASAGYPPDISDSAMLLDDLARWFDSPKESRHIILPFGVKDDPASLLRAMAAELRRKNEIRG